MIRTRAILPLAPLVIALLAIAAGGAATEPPPAAPESRPAAPEPPPPPPDSTEPEPSWGLPAEMAASLARQAEVYREYALRFTCDESARVAHYDEANEASRETTDRYAYLLERDPQGGSFREYRQVLKTRKQKDGERTETTGRDVDEESKFPPAYAWVFLFSRFHQPYFMYRNLGDRFEGFDWVHEIQFRGALPFTDGRDIRQWEGVALVDAVTLAPVEIRAEPSAQKERIRAMFDRWSKSFNLVGARLAPRPFGYRCRVGFGLRKDRLTFPTELRYDTFRAVGAKQFAPWMASVRRYEDYRFFKTTTVETPGPTVGR